MRTSITLDEDVRERIRRFQIARGIPFEEAVNLLLRAGFDHSPQGLYSTPAVSTGLPLADLVHGGDLAARDDEAEWARR